MTCSIHYGNGVRTRRDTLQDLAIVFSQLEQVVDCFVYVGFEIVDVRPFNFLAVGFDPVQQFHDVVVAPGDGNRHFLAAFDVAAVRGGSLSVYRSINWREAFGFSEHFVKIVDVLPCNTASIPLAMATVISMADIEYFPASRLFNSTVPQVLITNWTGLFGMFPNAHSYSGSVFTDENSDLVSSDGHVDRRVRVPMI